MNQQLKLFDHLTHRANLRSSRYGWLRLTPAYSVHLVKTVLDDVRLQPDSVVLDPFCGTGTTALVCAEQGIACDTVDINPFLVWLTKAKTQVYDPDDIRGLLEASQAIVEMVKTTSVLTPVWIPPLHQIEKWWSGEIVHILGFMMKMICDMEQSLDTRILDLLKIAFCRTMITHSNASFNHQSMSFKKTANYSPFFNPRDDVIITWEAAIHDLAQAARTIIVRPPRTFVGDARQLSTLLTAHYYACVITSPPYPNRMSYIRELRPYMYWLRYLSDGRQAGELDWQAIGGTWGAATSHVSKWVPPHQLSIPHPLFSTILERIAERSDALTRYVHKYFYDMAKHIEELFIVTAPGGSVHYIIGNSKFYDVLVPAEEILAALFEASGFTNIAIKPIRKRTSKKELYEYIVSAIKP